MITRFLSFFAVLLGLSQLAQAQFREVARTDIDPRITVTYSYELTSPGLNEEIRFKVKNNSARELRVTIKATARYQCIPTKNFTVGINGSVHLQPYELYDGSSDYVRSVTQKSKDCMREVEPGRYSSLIQCDFWVNIVDVSSEKEAKAAANKKKEDDQQKAAADTKAKLANSSSQNKTISNTTSTATRNSSQTTNEDDFWENGKSSQASQEKVAPKKLSDAEARAEVDKIMDKVKKDQAANDQIYKNIDQKFAQYAQASANNQAVAASRESLRDASSLSGNFQSVEQLMAEFNQKMSQVNSSVEQLKENKNAALNHAVNMNFSDPGFEAYGEVLKGVGGIVNAAKAAKERKEAQAALKAQKEAALNHMIAEEKRLLTGIRTDLFSKFKEGQVPLSSSKVTANTLYYFVYSYDPAQIGTKQPLLYVSNVFAINRYSDGTWPFKTKFTNEIQKLTPYSEVMHGYYASEQDAESMRRGMQDIFQKSGGTIKSIVYKNKKTNSSSSGATNGDFWETGAKKEATEKKPVKKDDFWEN